MRLSQSCTSESVEMKWMKWRVVDEKTIDVPSYNTFKYLNGKLERQHTKAPLTAALSPFMGLLYPPNPWCERCGVTTTPGPTSTTLFEQWCGFFYVSQEPDKCKCCETGPIGYCEPRIIRTEFVVLVEGKSEPFISCLFVCVKRLV